MGDFSPQEAQELELLKQHMKQLQQQKVEQYDKPLEYPLIDPIDLVGGALGGKAAAGAVSNVAEKTGLSSIPGRLMSMAAGTEYTPKVGQALVSEGLAGTKGMLRDQVAQSLEKHGSSLKEAVKSLSENISHSPAASEVRSLRSLLTAPDSGLPLSGAESGLKAISERAAQIEARGAPATPLDALSFKRGAGNLGFPGGEYSPTLASKIGQAESSAYGNQLADAYQSANPGSENIVASANNKLSALLKAKEGLATVEPPANNFYQLLRNATGSASVLPSVGAQLAQKGATYIAKPILAGSSVLAGDRIGHAIPEAQSPKPPETWSPDDQKELEQLKLMVK